MSLDLSRIEINDGIYTVDGKTRASSGTLLAPKIIDMTEKKQWSFKKLTHSEIQKINEETSKDVLDIGEALLKVFEKPTQQNINEAREATGNADNYIHPNTVYSCLILLKATVYPDNLNLRVLKQLSDAHGMEFENLAAYALRIYRGDKEADKKK